MNTWTNGGGWGIVFTGLTLRQQQKTHGQTRSTHLPTKRHDVYHRRGEDAPSINICQCKGDNYHMLVHVVWPPKRGAKVFIFVFVALRQESNIGMITAALLLVHSPITTLRCTGREQREQERPNCPAHGCARAQEQYHSLRFAAPSQCQPPDHRVWDEYKTTHQPSLVGATTSQITRQGYK